MIEALAALSTKLMITCAIIGFLTGLAVFVNEVNGGKPPDNLAYRITKRTAIFCGMYLMLWCVGLILSGIYCVWTTDF